MSGVERIDRLEDARSGARAVVVLHDRRLGPAFGGIRRMVYDGWEPAEADARRLAEAMSYKCAITGVAGSGGKAVILDDPALGPAGRRAAYELVARHVEALGGDYFTGPDVGTSAADLEVVAQITDRVAVPGRTGDLAEPTARGVFAGIQAALQHLGWTFEGRRFGVQGVGAVGGRVAERLARAGAVVIVGDVDADAVARCAASLSCEVAVDPAQIPELDLDVFVPCALGGLFDRERASRVGARVVAGSANNVLVDEAAGATLHERGVLYAPDFVINAGALIHGATCHLDGVPPPADRVDHLGAVLTEVWRESARQNRPPEQVALERAEQVMRGRAG